MTPEEIAENIVKVAILEDRNWRYHPNRISPRVAEQLLEGELKFSRLFEEYLESREPGGEIELAFRVIDEIAADPLLIAFWKYHKAYIKDRLDAQWQRLFPDVLRHDYDNTMEVINHASN